jgi:hypothetical protein
MRPIQNIGPVAERYRCIWPPPYIEHGTIWNVARRSPTTMTEVTAPESTQADSLAALAIAMEAVNDGKSQLNGMQSNMNRHHLALRRLTPPSACAL